MLMYARRHFMVRIRAHGRAAAAVAFASSAPMLTDGRAAAALAFAPLKVVLAEYLEEGPCSHVSEPRQLGHGLLTRPCLYDHCRHPALAWACCAVLFSHAADQSSPGEWLQGFVQVLI